MAITSSLSSVMNRSMHATPFSLLSSGAPSSNNIIASRLVDRQAVRKNAASDWRVPVSLGSFKGLSGWNGDSLSYWTLHRLHARDGSGSLLRRSAATPSDIARPGTWPLAATWNENWQPETELVVVHGGKSWKVTFVVDTGAAFTTLNHKTSRLLGLGTKSLKVSMSVNGLKLDVATSSGRNINILGADFFFASNAVIHGDFTGDEETEWKLTVSKGDERGDYSVANDEVPAVEPELRAFEGVIDVYGLVWVCFPTESRQQSKNITFIVDTANTGIWMTRSHLENLGFSQHDINETHKGYENGLELNIAGAPHIVLASRNFYRGYNLLGTTFFTDARVLFELNYKDRSVRFNFGRA